MKSIFKWHKLLPLHVPNPKGFYKTFYNLWGCCHSFSQEKKKCILLYITFFDMENASKQGMYINKSWDINTEQYVSLKRFFIT